MGDFFLVQMDDVFAEGVCFDNRKEGEGGAPNRRSPILRRSVWAVRAAAARHHFQTLHFLAHGFLEDGVGQENQPARGQRGERTESLASPTDVVRNMLW
jgi:hypothetical protein